MKIFNWMHRKLHQGTDYSLVPYTKEALNGIELSSGVCGDERDTEGLLNPMLFLTIGTLGHGHPDLSLPPIQEVQEQQKQVEEEQQQQGCPAPAVQHHQLLIGSEFMEAENTKLVEALLLTARVEEMKRPSCEILEPLLSKEADTEKMGGRGRTTLADLFAADADTANSSKVSSLVPEADAGGKTLADTCSTKICKKLAKKGENPRPRPPPAITKKLQRLMTKMLKKKIHPDVRGAASSDADQEQGHLLPKTMMEHEDYTKVAT